MPENSLRALDLEVAARERRLPVVREVLVELVVLLVGDLGLRALPERVALVDALARRLDLGVRASAFVALDGARSDSAT